MTKKYVVWFKEVGKEDVDLVGGKGANLGEMTQAGFPVPPGFIITVNAYYDFLEEAKIRDKITTILLGIDVNNSKLLEDSSEKVKKLILNADFPEAIARDILAAYFKLDSGLARHALVAVRSSATAEDLPGASFAGQQETFLNVHGESNLIEKVKACWASLFTARAIFYRVTNKFDHFKVGIAIPVQKMIESEESGIMFTIDPVTNDKSKIVIEAILGLGEMIVQGEVTPDHYEVAKKTGVITLKTVNCQEKMMLKKGSVNEILPVPAAQANRQKLDDPAIIKLAVLGEKLEKHYFFPQDIEWAFEKGKLYIVQTRPVTTVGKEATNRSSMGTTKNKLLVKGDPASPGIASGPVKILTSPKEIGKIDKGDILVAEMTNPDYVPAMRRAAAIVTEKGGRTSHAAIVSRELGIPAVVGARDAKKVLKEGMVVTVNGATGEVFRGASSTNIKYQASNIKKETSKNLKTATRVYVNLAESERAREIAKLNVDGVGLLRAEFMIAEIGVHPKKLIAERRQKVFTDKLSAHLETICSSFSPRPVIYRATDFKTNEYRHLKGGEAYEPAEPNPMLGFRGAARFVANPEVFELELEAMKIVRNKMGYKNLWLMIPFVRTPLELLEVKKIVAGAGLLRSESFKLYMMVEIPTNVIRLNDFLDIGIDGVSIGSNDLTMLILGTDRDNSEVAHDFSERDPAVLWALESVIRTCASRHILSSICGQAPSDYPDLVEKLVSWGITSVSVNPDALASVRQTVYEAEEMVVKRR